MNQPETKVTGLRRLWVASRYSMMGLRAAFQHEPSFRQEIILACVAIPAALWVGQTGVERALLIASVLMILVVEVLNSGLESVVDRFGGEIHELSGRAKDLGSAAVFLTILTAGTVWCLVILG